MDSLIITLLFLTTSGLAYMARYYQRLLSWVDARQDQALTPLVQAVGAMHMAGAPRHSQAEIAGRSDALVEVDVDPENLPEGENWIVDGDKVYVKRQEFVVARQGLRQLELLEEMEGARQSLVAEVRKLYQHLVEWERDHPVPQWPHAVLWRWVVSHVKEKETPR